jgi:DNA mismatch repair protein MutL
LNFAITEAYSAFLVKGKYPQVVLFLTCDPSGVDVNVHPAKREIKFKEDNRIRSVVLRAILSVLKRWADDKIPQQVVGVPVSTLSLGEFKNPLTSLRSSTPQVSEIAQPYVQTAPNPKAVPDAVVKDANVSTRIPWKYLGASQTGYLLYDTQVGIVVLDYKAALERIWYERILNECISQRVPSQALLVSLSLDLDPVSSALLLDHKAVFESYGFIIAEFGRHFYRIESVPAWLEVGDAEQFLKDMIAALREENLTSLGLSFIQEHVAKMAALKQVAKGVESKDIKPQVLVDDLFATKKPLISPRGRPVFFELDQAELNRRFTSR